MVLIPAGEFAMGSNDGDPDEKPVHQVYLDSYYMDRYEVTNTSYRGCVDAGYCTPPQRTSSLTHDDYFFNHEFDDYPVIYADWGQARDYCAWRGTYLPTEAQWEKAARGTDGRTYPWGEELSCVHSNYSIPGICTEDTTPVGSYESGASPYGVYDMAGNPYEWVADWYSDTYYQYSPTSNPQGPVSGEHRVVRGGHNDARTSARFRVVPEFTTFYVIGFRCAQDASEQGAP
jgi:formylglycine-generating enzyme required for sulfatase activity